MAMQQPTPTVTIPHQPFAALKPIPVLDNYRNHGIILVTIPHQPFAALKPSNLRTTILEQHLVTIPHQPFAALKLLLMAPPL